MLNSVTKNGLILSAFAIVTTAAIALTFVGTRDEIEQQRLALLQRTLEAVMPPAYHDNSLASACTLVENTQLHGEGAQRIYRAELAGEPAGLVVESTAPNGYSGNIHLLVGVTLEGVVTGVRVLEHRETPGLGDKIDLRVSDWILSFLGKQVTTENADRWQVKKDGGQFDQFTGATITPRAVVRQVRKTVLTALENQQQWFAQPTNCALAKGQA
ncbi:electron transport complex subunit RsxG [Alteromonas flava]|uniref:electron transport complex subunit RsxG n=1 Tax=Alteromonas flava TaxID=2048003 RepID=UPI000C281B56|nr:electron transport complex subunit RsxG [Alteromonas flava]